MNKTIKVILATIMAFGINGCLDKGGEYGGSQFEKVHIQDLSDGYEITSNADYNGINALLTLSFCKNNKFIIMHSGGNGIRYEGVYKVNLDEETISLVTDGSRTTNGSSTNGKKLRDTLKVKDGYIKQKHPLRDISLESGRNKNKIHLYMRDITHIMSIDCSKI